MLYEEVSRRLPTWTTLWVCTYIQNACHKTAKYLCCFCFSWSSAVTVNGDQRKTCDSSQNISVTLQPKCYGMYSCLYLLLFPWAFIYIQWCNARFYVLRYLVLILVLQCLPLVTCFYHRTSYPKFPFPFSLYLYTSLGCVLFKIPSSLP